MIYNVLMYNIGGTHNLNFKFILSSDVNRKMKIFILRTFDTKL